MLLNRLFNYKATLCYISFIIIINFSYPYFPFITIAHTPFSSGDMLIGIIYVLRDFTQREINHYVILAMLFGTGISYLLADKSIAIASICSFMIGEFIDWGIFTFTGKPLSQRLLWSSAISAPIDSMVFLAIYGPFNLAGISVISFSKVLGVLLLWYLWRRRVQSSAINALA
jgi:queuosine precursor transporter